MFIFYIVMFTVLLKFYFMVSFYNIATIYIITLNMSRIYHITVDFHKIKLIQQGMHESTKLV